MAQDIRDLFKNEKVSHEKMPQHHQDRFLKRLDEAFPEKNTSTSNYVWMRVAASIVLLIGLSFGAYKFINPNTSGIEETQTIVNSESTVATKTLGDISPGLKKVEDYYLASINLELSKIKYSPENKDLFDGYIEQLAELDTEYKKLSKELTNSVPSELTVNALIDNLKLRLNLLYRLKSQLEELTPSEVGTEEVKQIS
ncbi:hypothetical protein [Seonamhaeicola sp. ML3]|uniref:hypothetical protein n=1 Tax=Seonamhaeicola sp. ML3 TaxID=2937786 RepID=UPI002010A054|nr:hypothetical protein [Seonamhaeicola sp. ML3]